MKLCRECKEIISVGFNDLDSNGELPSPKAWTNLNFPVCDECTKKAVKYLLKQGRERQWN